ncbi:MAG: OmpA family protein, partial [Candidatus Latescibacterota bacterium]
PVLLLAGALLAGAAAVRGAEADEEPVPAVTAPYRITRVHLLPGLQGIQAAVSRGAYTADFGSREGVRVGSVFSAYSQGELIGVLRVREVWRDSVALELVELVDKADPDSPRPLEAGTYLRPKLVFLESIQFHEGALDLSLGMRQRLFDVTRFVRAYPDCPLLIEGHTDDAGKAAENLKLSAERARTVLTMLHEVYRVPVGQMRAVGRGETQPIAGNGTEEGRRRNRRVELMLVDALPDTQSAAKPKAAPAGSRAGIQPARSGRR